MASLGDDAASGQPPAGHRRPGQPKHCYNGLDIGCLMHTVRHAIGPSVIGSGVRTALAKRPKYARQNPTHRKILEGADMGHPRPMQLWKAELPNQHRRRKGCKRLPGRFEHRRRLGLMASRTTSSDANRATPRRPRITRGHTSMRSGRVVRTLVRRYRLAAPEAMGG